MEKIEPFVTTINERKYLDTPNGTAQKHCIAWMQQYFTLIGDNDPTSQNVHLEQQFKSEIYADYRKEFTLTGWSIILHGTYY